MRLEYILCNGLHGLAFQSWMGRNWAVYLYISTPRLGVLESPNHNCNCSTLTVPMSHCMYIKWWGIVEIRKHCLQWSPRAGFSVIDGEKLVLLLSFQHQDWVSWSPQTITAAPWLFQCLIVCVSNGEAWLRLECIVCNGLHGLLFQSWMERNWALYLHIPMHHDWVSYGVPKP